MYVNSFKFINFGILQIQLLIWSLKDKRYEENLSLIDNGWFD